MSSIKALRGEVRRLLAVKNACILVGERKEADEIEAQLVPVQLELARAIVLDHKERRGDGVSKADEPGRKPK